MSATFIYIRVSTDEQAKVSGLGLEVQESECRAFAASQGLSVSAVFTDGGVSRSTYLTERPAMSALLASIKKGTTVIVHKHCRLGDSVAIAMMMKECKRKGARLLVVHGDNSGSDEALLLAGVLSIISDHELRSIASRTRKALAKKKERGEVYTRRVYGFRAVKNQLIADDAEQAVIDRIKTEASSGLSWAAIARGLNLARVAAPSGTDWHPRTVQRIAERASAA
ncbi:Putative DNA-invertase from lambdoid prophage Rac [Caulifigura coniformis]|uniref:DNA-invertase from lambdoid prophage Rac n=1 Tax=Caulifigura coniformis TaxID=2527983 RepID=A0A517SKP9_9PLAN|nr:recombinase family protein [Caulifigura coniformis]QDT56705.1 Putative DNA-invertase from lambdoid prophage Rac [Caulifigura coniformis]